MNFFTTTDGQQIQSGTDFSESNDFQPIPKNTKLIAIVTEACWDEYEGERNIKLKWQVVNGDFANRILFSSLRVNSPEKRDRALKMLAAIDANCGGKLLASGETPTDNSLTMALTNKPMMIMVDLWTNPQTGKTKNFVIQIASAGNNVAQVQRPPAQQMQQPAQQMQQPAQQVQQVQQPAFDDVPF